MAPLITPDCWQVKAMFHDANTNWSNVYGIDVGAIPVLTQGAADDVRNAFLDSWNANLADLCPAETGFDGVVVTDTRTEGGPQFTADANAVGTAVSDRSPDQLAVVVTLRTALRTRAGRGRTYLGGFAELTNDANGRITAACMEACGDYIQAIIGDLAAASFSGDLAVISRKDPPLGYTGQGRQIVSFEVRDNQWDQQRRRVAAS